MSPFLKEPRGSWVIMPDDGTFRSTGRGTYRATTSNTATWPRTFLLKFDIKCQNKDMIGYFGLNTLTSVMFIHCSRYIDRHFKVYIILFLFVTFGRCCPLLSAVWQTWQCGSVDHHSRIARNPNPEFHLKRILLARLCQCFNKHFVKLCTHVR